MHGPHQGKCGPHLNLMSSSVNRKIELDCSEENHDACELMIDKALDKMELQRRIHVANLKYLGSGFVVVVWKHL